MGRRAQRGLCSGLSLLAALLVLLAARVRPARAQSGIQLVQAPTPAYAFASSITFTVTARSSANIIAAVLYVSSGGASPTTWPSRPFQPAQQVTASAGFDLGLNPLTPFSDVRYWWQLDDSAGQTLTTPPATFTYEDNRFDWRTVSSGAITVHWYRGDATFGQQAADIATAALPQITQDVRAPLPPQINIYIYATDADVQGALGPAGVAYANGHADPKLGVAIISVAPDLRAQYNLQILVPHEMTHLLIYRATGANYARVPYWFNEGLAVMHQAQRDSSFPALLAAARDSQQFLSLSSLCGPFNPATVNLAYAESESVVRYIRDQFGSEGINRLLTAYANGAGCDAGVQNSLGLSLDQLQAQWQQAQAPPPESVAQRLQDLAPWLVLAALVLAAPVTLYLAAFQRNR